MIPSSQITEYSIDLPDNKVLTLTTWSNGAGCSIQITGQNLQLQLTGLCTWEELETLLQLGHQALIATK